LNGNQVIQQWMETDHDASGGTYNANFLNPSTTTHGQVLDDAILAVRIHNGCTISIWGQVE